MFQPADRARATSPSVLTLFAEKARVPTSGPPGASLIGRFGAANVKFIRVRQDVAVGIMPIAVDVI